MLGKKTLIFVAAAIFLSSIPALAATTLPDVVAVVNGEKITKEEVLKILIDWQAPLVLQELIDARVIGQEAKKAGVVVTVDDVKAKMEEMKKNLPPGMTFDDYLKRQGLTPGHLFAVIKMREQAIGVVHKSVKVTADDLAGFRRASHILIRIAYASEPKEKEQKDQEAKEKIEKIAAEIKGGLDFSEAAKTYSEDLPTKDKGGDLDFFPKNYMAPEFEQAVFKMEPGQISEPVKTSYGYHLIKLVAIGRDAKGEDKKKLEDKIVQQRLAEKLGEWFLSTRNKAKIDNRIEPAKPEPPPIIEQPIVSPVPPRPETEPEAEPEEAPPAPPTEAAPATTAPVPEAAPSAEPPVPEAEPAQPAPAPDAQPAPSEPAK
jgi:foldase protein PrsA